MQVLTSKPTKLIGDEEQIRIEERSSSATSNIILNVNGWIFMLMIIGETLRSVSELNARVKRTKIDKRINRHGRKGGSRNGLIWLESCWWKAKHVTHVTHKWAKTTNLFPALQYQRITEWQYFCLIYKWRKAELLLTKSKCK